MTAEVMRWMFGAFLMSGAVFFFWQTRELFLAWQEIEELKKRIGPVN